MNRMRTRMHMRVYNPAMRTWAVIWKKHPLPDP